VIGNFLAGYRIILAVLFEQSAVHEGRPDAVAQFDHPFLITVDLCDDLVISKQRGVKDALVLRGHKSQ
jgi:hypothetical protein